jgi:glycosyltransferase involved in cell wall biosynthesis
VATAPQVSIVMPLYDDEEFVSAAIESCLAQTLRDIEVICVDDASTDGTVALIQKYQERDARIRLIRQPQNLSAFQARRTGIAAASAPFVLFLDGDDELAPRAAEIALARARSTRADVVGFGVEIVAPDGVPSRLAAALQPTHDELKASAIIPALFPTGEPANGHLWRYLFETALLRAAYDGLGDGLTFYRANDLPISFLALAHAKKYVSVTDRLYRYHFRRGTSGHRVDGVEYFSFLLSGVEPITAITDTVHALAEQSTAPSAMIESYESARLHIIGNILRYAIRDTSGELRRTCVTMLAEKVDSLDLLRAAVAFCPEALAALSTSVQSPTMPATVSSVLMTTRRLDTGGLQSVLLDQAEYLASTGLRVIIVVMESAERELDLPPGVDVVELTYDSESARVDQWVAICRERAVDVVIDHHILYNEHWPWRALAALAVGVPTIGWLHNFALRPLFDHSERVSFLDTHLPVLAQVVTLSPTDVVFWKLRGLQHVAYIPNPASPLTSAALESGSDRTYDGGTLELAWWGRLNNTTKQVLHLVDVAAELKRRGVDFRLSIVGPDSRDLSAMQVRQHAISRGVDDVIDLLGEQSTEQLLTTLSSAHLLVSTSAIEGYQLTILEAQAMGMPVVMYDLPWLVTVRGNPGVLTTPPDDPTALADAIAAVARDPERYSELSLRGRQHATASAAVDINRLLLALLQSEPPSEFSPEPSLDEARLLVDWLVRIGERGIRESAEQALALDVDTIKRERDLARAKLRQITEGPSFRIGRALTRFPRAVKERLRPTKPSGAFARISTAGERVPIVAPPPPLRAPADAPLPARSGTPDISFVIPVFNAEAWLEDCVMSVLAQTGVDVEVICINDGSTDRSREILDRLAAADSRVTVITQPNSGQSVARNKGLDAAEGRYLIYLDSDDYWPADVAQSLVRRADGAELDLLLFDCIAFRDGDIEAKVWKRYSTYYQRAHNYRGVRTGVDLMAAMRRTKDYRPHVGLYMTRTSFVRRLGVRFIPGIVHQDNPYTFRLMLHAGRAAYERIDAYARRMRPGSTITTLNAERSARGYYLSYIEMTRELASYQLAADVADPVNNIVAYVYEGARKQFALLSAPAVDDLRSLDESADAQRIFASLMESSEDAR